jgi:PPM family protein phosphatase
MSRSSNAPSEIHVAAACDVGLVRKKNEDYVYVNGQGLRDSRLKNRFSGDVLYRGLIVSVADGVGGGVDGDRASLEVSRQMGDHLMNMPGGLSRNQLIDELRHTADQVNTRLVAGSARDQDSRTMATTYTGVFMRGGFCVFVHSGDSRLYELRSGRLHQISRDHSLRELMGDPRIPGNIIANCFGRESDFYVDTGRLDPCDADMYMMCSDGLSDYTSHKWVEQRLTRSAGGTEVGLLSRACLDLVEAAKSAGGGDNISIALIRPVYA